MSEEINHEQESVEQEKSGESCKRKRCGKRGRCGRFLFGLLALAAEVASAYDAEVSGDQINIMGDELMLSRLLRNLLENGSRYAVNAPPLCDSGES